MKHYWKVMLQLPTIEGWEGEKSEEEGYSIYSVWFTPLNQVVMDLQLPPIEEFSCTKWYKRRFKANLETQDHYTTFWPITNVFFNDGKGEQPVEFLGPEFRVLFGKYTGTKCIHVTDTTDSCILEGGDTVWFLFEATGDMERFKLLGMTSDPDPPADNATQPDFLSRIQQHLWELVPQNPQLRRQLLIAGLQRILWPLVDAPQDWSLAFWVTHVGLYLYPWDLADGLELDAFEEAVEHDITHITPASAFYVK